MACLFRSWRSTTFYQQEKQPVTNLTSLCKNKKGRIVKSQKLYLATEDKKFWRAMVASDLNKHGVSIKNTRGMTLYRKVNSQSYLYISGGYFLSSHYSYHCRVRAGVDDCNSIQIRQSSSILNGLQRFFKYQLQVKHCKFSSVRQKHLNRINKKNYQHSTSIFPVLCCYCRAPLIYLGNILK